MTPISIKQALDDAKVERTKAINNLSVKRSFLDIDPKTFKELVVLKSERIFHERSEAKSYSFDDLNKPMIQQLYYYVSGNKKFSGDLNKGIHLWGDYGCGKSSLLQSVCEIITEISDRRIEMLIAKEMGIKILEKGIAYFYKRPLYVDDVGREPREVKTFGNLLKPVPDLYYYRKEFGAWTFQTCQRPVAGLESEYGKFTTDRMRAAFNEIHFKGTSRR